MYIFTYKQHNNLKKCFANKFYRYFFTVYRKLFFKNNNWINLCVKYYKQKLKNMARKFEMKLLTRFLLVMMGIIAVSYVGANLYLGDEATTPQAINIVESKPVKSEKDIIENQQKRIDELESKLIEQKKANEIYKVVDQMPRFPGCENEGDEMEKKYCSTDKMLKFIYRNIKYPEKARDNGSEGTAVISFVVEKNGSIVNPKIVRNVAGGCGEEALRVVKKMPNWTPGKQRGKTVRVQFNLPIKFKLQ